MTDTTPADEQCCEVPLIELLRRVPRDARFWERTETESTHYPVGRLCHEAADALEQARAALSQQAEPVALERWGVIWPRNHTGEPTFAQFSDGYWTPWHIANEALQRAALPQQQAEPVAWLYDVWEHVGGKARVQFAAIDWSPAPGDTRVLIKKVPLYAAPPADEAVTLLREAYELEHWTLTPKLREAIGAYLAKVKC
jgi:hypothetical protein